MTLLPVLLPEGYEPTVSVNDKLTVGSLIAEKKGAKSEEIIHVSKVLNDSPSNLDKSVQKNLGDSITSGEVLAIKKGKLGLGAKKVLSKFSGTVVKIDTEAGEVTIRTNNLGFSESLFSPIDGIVDFCNNEKIVIKSQNHAVMADDSTGKEKTGELVYIQDFDQNKLTSEVEDKILLVKKIDKASLFKAIGLDAGGIITQSLDGADFVDLCEKNIEAAIMIVSEDNFKKLEKMDGKKVFLDIKDKGIVSV